jgi:hypothetical protein
MKTHAVRHVKRVPLEAQDVVSFTATYINDESLENTVQCGAMRNRRPQTRLTSVDAVHGNEPLKMDDKLLQKISHKFFNEKKKLVEK